MSKLKVALLCGGSSEEREISLLSGDCVFKSLNKQKYDITIIDPSKKEELQLLFTNPYDVAFIALHGKGGEDGVIQGLLEQLKIPYTGSGILASALAMNKSYAKLIYSNFHLKAIPGITISTNEEYDINNIIETVGFPCIIKPQSEGSSIGLKIINNKEDFKDGIEEVFKIEDKIIIEKYIQGTELTVAVLGNNNPEALPPIEIVTLISNTYDYESKYTQGGCEHICPARISEKHLEEVKNMAIIAHKSLNCRGVSRSDFILDNNGKIWILETNTIPGMTLQSLLPDTAKVAGYSFEELCDKLIALALED